MADLDLTTLRLFVAVCETRNITRAAEGVGLVGSAISKRLAQLEEHAGVALLVRRRHGVELTPAGETLLEHARAMLASARHAERDMAAYSAGVKGQVRLLATASVLAESLADDVAAFLRRPEHADIRVNLEERVSAEVVRGIHQGSASLGLCWASSHSVDLTDLQTRPYRSDHLSVVVHPTHPLANRRDLSFADTLPYEHVVMPLASAVNLMLQRAAAALGQSVQQRVVVSSFEAALRVVQAGLAISVVPREVAQFYAATHKLCILGLNEPWAQRQFAICFKGKTGLSPAAELLLAHLVASGQGQAAAAGLQSAPESGPARPRLADSSASA